MRVQLEVAVTAALGEAADDTPVTDPEAETASITGLLRGLLAEAQAQTALLTTIAANTTPAP